MKRFRAALWGIALVGAGIVLGLHTLGILSGNLFFDGWWTLFILVPSLIGLLTERDKTGSIVGLAVGGMLLLWRQKVISLAVFWKLLVPALLVIIGLRILWEAVFAKKKNPPVEWKDFGAVKTASAVFTGGKVQYEGETFTGLQATAVFGGMECDLTRAVMESDALLRATAVFGGITIKVPDSVNVRVVCRGVFGGADNRVKPENLPDRPTLTVDATSVFGGVEIKA